jgi:XTP/dITP diphosphohydrolase
MKTIPDLVFATGNRGKVREVSRIIGKFMQFRSLDDIGCTEEIPETSPTIAGNALQKAQYVYEKYGENCFAEDTGLEIEHLEGAPGVFTARYAGDSKDPKANMQLVIDQMRLATNRHARFVTVFALIIDGETFLFEGIADGVILEEFNGEEGFGYDPIFMPKEQPNPNQPNRSYAQMSLEEKNTISHRAKALALLVDFLKAKYVD